MAVDKPAGLLSQPGLGPEQSDSVITRLQQQDQSLRLVHRLDRDTSGVLILARSADALRRLSACLLNGGSTSSTRRRWRGNSMAAVAAPAPGHACRANRRATAATPRDVWH
mgnify:CR=1 FL=1